MLMELTDWVVKDVRISLVAVYSSPADKNVKLIKEKCILQISGCSHKKLYINMLNN
jgi:hypothetical protein